jgi:hypothetical protein
MAKNMEDQSDDNELVTWTIVTWTIEPTPSPHWGACLLWASVDRPYVEKKRKA